MWEPIWASRSRYWLLTGDVSWSCLHCSRTRRVRTLKVSMTVILWVYEFWCTEGVLSPGWDRGHDEESRNGRDVKIDILDDYIRSSERFRVIRVFFGVPESYGNSPGSIWALLGHTGIEERGQKEGGLRPPSGPNWTRRGGGAPLFPSPLSPFLPLLVGVGKEES